MPWVGKMEDDFVVYENELQIEESKYLKLWSYSRNDVLSFERESARTRVRSVTDDTQRDKVVKKFAKWKDSSFYSYLALEKEAARNRKKFEISKKYVGRVTWCRRCALPLTANISNVCSSCEWIICSACGECNC